MGIAQVDSPLESNVVQHGTHRKATRARLSAYALAASCGLALTVLAGQPAQAATSTDLEDCSSCHVAETASFEEDANSLASVHPTLKQECTDCHDTSDRGFAIVHKKTEGKAMPATLKRTKASAESCSSCHDARGLAKATEDIALVDDKGTEVNPHDLPSNESHDALTCFSCHSFHGLSASNAAAQSASAEAAEVAPGQNADAKTGIQANGEASAPMSADASGQNGASDATGPLATTYDDARSLCISCHHAGVYECGTCH